MDAVYELHSGDFVDLSNLISVGNFYFLDTSFPSFPSFEARQSIRCGNFYFKCNFRFFKETIEFSDDNTVYGEEEIEERRKFLEHERQKLKNAWNLYKDSEKNKC